MSVQYEYVTEPGRAHEICKQLLEAKNVSGDTESTGLDPHKDKVTLLSLSSRKHGTFVIDTRNQKNLEAFTELFESENTIKTMHNGVHDYKLIKGTTGAETENIICTMLGERALTAGRQFGGASLDAITEKYLGIKRDKTLQKSFINNWNESTPEQRLYSAEDAHYLLQIAEKQQAQAKTDGVLRTWRTESEALQSFGDIEFYGQKINKIGWEDVIKENIRVADEAKKELDYFFEPFCNKRFNFDKKAETDPDFVIDMNYESVPMVLSCLKKMGVSVDGGIIENTSKRTQKKIAGHPAIQALMKYRTAMQGVKMFGEQYIGAIHPVTGRVHFKIKQYGTDTGRPSCGSDQGHKRGDPKLNCLNIPRDMRYRKCFETDLDRLISTVDYSGAELRIMADLSGDPLMVKGFNSGVDFHCFVASLLFNREVTKKNENSALRTPTKTLNFGLAYGMGVGSLFEQVNAAGHKITMDECKWLFRKYMETFQVTIAWLKEQQRMASTNFIMRNINGRVRYFHEPNEEHIREAIVAELLKKNQLHLTNEWEVSNLVKEKVKSQLAAIQREGANFNIQSVNADFSKRAMHRNRKEFKRRKWDIRTYNMVYDELVYDMHKSCAEEAHEVQKKIMIECANEMLTQVPMEVEGHLAPHWLK